MAEHIPPPATNVENEPVPFVGVEGKKAIMDALRQNFGEDIVIGAKFKMDGSIASSTLGPRDLIERYIDGLNFNKIELVEATSFGPIEEDTRPNAEVSEAPPQRTKYIVVRHKLPDESRDVLKIYRIDPKMSEERAAEFYNQAAREAKAASIPGKEYEVRIHVDGKEPQYVKEYLINKGP